MESRPTTYAGRRRVGSASEIEVGPKQEPIGSYPGGGQRTRARVPFRPSLPSRSRSGANWDPDRLLRWILAAVVVIGIGLACAVIIALVITFG